MADTLLPSPSLVTVRLCSLFLISSGSIHISQEIREPHWGWG
jgi:hypothetical protein